MSSVTQESSPPQPKQVEERTGLQKGIDWVGKHWPRVRLAHEGWMLDKIARQQRIVEVTARNTMTGNMKDTSGLPIDEEDDRMGVRIGDEISNHYYGLQRQEGTAAESPPTEDKRSLVSKLLPWILAAAIPMSAGLGALGAHLRGGSEETPVVTDWALQIEKIGAEP